jgi:hypothetical protein
LLVMRREMFEEPGELRADDDDYDGRCTRSVSMSMSMNGWRLQQFLERVLLDAGTRVAMAKGTCNEPGDQRLPQYEVNNPE